MLGQCPSDRLEKTVRIHGLKLIGTFTICNESVVLNARQKNPREKWKGGSQIPGERPTLIS
jgi:hypothetical protein